MADKKMLATLYALRAGLSQLMIYLSKVETRSSMRRVDSNAEILLAHELKNALLAYCGKKIPRSYWHSVDTLIYYVQSSLANGFQEALRLVALNRKKENEFEDDMKGFQTAYDEIGLGCPDCNEQLLIELQELALNVKDVQIQSEFFFRYSGSDMENKVLKYIVEYDVITAQRLRYALTKKFDTPSCLAKNALRKLTKYEKEMSL